MFIVKYLWYSYIKEILLEIYYIQWIRKLKLKIFKVEKAFYHLTIYF